MFLIYIHLVFIEALYPACLDLERSQGGQAPETPSNSNYKGLHKINRL